MVRAGVAGLLIFGCALLSPVSASAQQQSTSGIAGVVRDATGRPIAGVKVEASSDVLIERVRVVQTDAGGQFKIIDLRPGAYVVTFTAPGFVTVRNEGIDLPSAFTMTVNGTLQAGSPEQTVTVSGVVTQVDTQSTSSEKVLTGETVNNLPTGQTNFTTAMTLTPGLNNGNGQNDVGGSEGAMGQQMNLTSYHGKVGVRSQYDGLRTSNFCNGGFPAYIVNMQTVQDISVQTSGISAETSSTGAGLNMIGKTGSNTWKFSATGLFGDDKLESDNLTSGLQALGLTSTSKVVDRYDIGSTEAGPIVKDKLWLLMNNRYWGSKTQFAGIYYDATEGAPTYSPNLSKPGYRSEWTVSPAATRVTWQITPKNKLNLFSDLQRGCVCQAETLGGADPESIAGWTMWPTGGFMATWTSPVTSKLLLEAGVGAMIFHYPYYLQPEVTPGAVSTLDLATNIRYNAPAGAFANPINYTDRLDERFSVSYVTGSHAFKFGFTDEQARQWSSDTLSGANSQGVTYQFLSGKPNSVVEYALPYYIKQNQQAEIGLFAQDRWTLRRFTFNYGLRYDNIVQGVPAQSAGAGPFTPARSYAGIPNIPNWKDFSPRLGVAYDLFGNGKTALKASLAKYLNLTGDTLVAANNPINTSVNSVTRTWNDGNGNNFPDCNLQNPVANGECGPISNANFGLDNPRATTFASSIMQGWDVEPHFWEYGFEVQQQVRDGVVVTGGYYHNWVKNFLVTDNTAVAQSNYSPYCITAPTNPNLPGGGGYPVCGLYDISPAKFNSVTNVVQGAAPFVGSSSNVNCGYQTPGNGTTTGAAAYDTCGNNDFLNLTLSARLAKGIRIGGGVDSGRSEKNNCFVVNSPEQLLYCDQVVPFLKNTQIKMNVTYPLPFWGVTLSAVYQDIPGPVILANYNAPNSAIAASLGRNLGACGTQTACTATAQVPLVQPDTMFDPRRHQVDLRIAKSFPLGGRARLNANVGLFNAFNASSIITINTTYGPQWLQPTQILAPRILQFGGTVTF